MEQKKKCVKINLNCLKNLEIGIHAVIQMEIGANQNEAGEIPAK